MSKVEKSIGRYTAKDMHKPPTVCDRDRVAGGWTHVVAPTIFRMGLCPDQVTMIDVGSGDGRKSLKKYAYDRDNKNNLTDPSKYGLLTSNMAAIEGDPKKIDALKENIPDGEVFLLDFSQTSLSTLGIQKRYHVALLCEVLEHLFPGPEQLRLLRDIAELLTPGGGMHVTFPRNTNLDNPMRKPWGHKCKEVPRHDVMNVLTELFDEVTWAQSTTSQSVSGVGTVNFFALGRR